jgi:UDP-N-acetylenolpyruvoylglucosamine reductase
MQTQEILIAVLGKDRVYKDKDLFPHLTLRTHAHAEFFFEAKTKEELILAYTTGIQNGISVRIIGGGSNIALLAGHIPSLVIKNSYSELRIVSEQENDVEVFVSSGYIVSRLVGTALEKGWEGMEYHKGLPGTLGGAIFMNSKWTRPVSYMGDTLIQATVLEKTGAVKSVDRSYFQFAYDYSILQETGEIFIDGIFRFKKNDPDVLRSRADEALEYRKKTQPYGVATCGCFFRNIAKEDMERLQIPTASAGYLIDRAGMKNMSVGSFKVSDLHANFIINTGSGTGSAEDLLQLVNKIKDKVRQTYNVELQEEVVII